MGIPQRGLNLGETPRPDEEMKELGELGLFPAASAKQLSVQGSRGLKRKANPVPVCREDGRNWMYSFELCGEEGAPWKAKEVGKL